MYTSYFIEYSKTLRVLFCHFERMFLKKDVIQILPTIPLNLLNSAHANFFMKLIIKIRKPVTLDIITPTILSAGAIHIHIHHIRILNTGTNYCPSKLIYLA